MTYVGQEQTIHFAVYDTDGVTPLTGQASGCSSDLLYNGSLISLTVTIAEVGSTGYYTAKFTPTSIGAYGLFITTPDKRVINANLDTNDFNITKLLGLGKENTVYEMTKNAAGKVTGGKIYHYNSAANKATNDHTTGLLYSYTVDTTIVSEEYTQFEMELD